MKTDINLFLETINRSPKTVFAYRNGLSQFVKVVGENAELNTETCIKFLISLQNKSSSTQRVYRTAVLKFYAFCKVGNLAELQEAAKQYTRRSGKQIVKFDREAVEKVIVYCESLQEDLEALRDRAFVLTLVDTGLRISEACSLQRSDIDWIEQRAIIGKDDKQAVVRFLNRCINALKAYLYVRSTVEPNPRKPIGSQPLEEAGIERNAVRIHDFRHYFVMMTYLAKKDLKLAQELARHGSISTTYRYAHFGSEADTAYDEIFNKRGNTERHND